MEKIKIIQIGILHEHASGKFATLKKRPDLFDILGFVDERGFCRTPHCPETFQPGQYEGFRKFTLDEALNCPGLDAVTVEVPNNDLVPTAMRFMEKGIAMHMDKPAGETLEPYRELLEGCKKRNVPFQMGYMFRGNPAFQFCIRAVREKLIGEVFEFQADMNHCYLGAGYREFIGKFPGGLMHNLGSHLVDFVVAAMGRPEKVTPFLKSAPGYPDHLHNNCMAVLEYPHAFVTLRSCSESAGNTGARAIRIAGTKGTISFSPVERFDGKSVEVELIMREENGGFPKGSHTLRFTPQRDRYEVQLEELARVIRGEAQPSYSYEHDLLVHEVLLAASGLAKWA